MSRKNNLAQIWAERIEACHASGSNVKAWCRENNVSASQYYYWIKKLNNNVNEIVGDNSVEWAEVSLKPVATSGVPSSEGPPGVVLKV